MSEGPEVSKVMESRRIDGPFEGPSARCVNGTFVGRSDADGVASFKGIPFTAEPPTGRNRWRPPVPYREDGGTYSAFDFGPAPFQVESVDCEGRMSEDCLYLNVWTPDPSPGAGRPVIVWIHGGAFVIGSTNKPVYDGTAFARDGGAVFVSVGYRLGLLGFLNLSNVPGGEDYRDSQNLGILDQAMALRWVHENIAAFGGDPSNITLMGQSAGAASVVLLCMHPEASKMVRRAIVQSGSPVFTRSTEESLIQTNKVMGRLKATSVYDLLSEHASSLVNASLMSSFGIWPERDGRTVPLDPFPDLESGAMAGIDLMVGSNADESNFFIGEVRIPGPLKGLVLRLAIRLKLLKQYPRDQRRDAVAFMKGFPSRLEGALAMYNQMNFTVPAVRMADCHSAAGGRTYQYHWTWGSSRPDIGACHAVEIPAVFGNIREGDDTGFTPEFSSEVRGMWASFAASGIPSPEWREYDVEGRRIMVFSRDGTGMDDGVAAEICDPRIRRMSGRMFM